MSKNISTQFFLEQDFGSGNKMILRTSSNKKDILDLYRLVCETNPKCKYRVFKEETLTEMIAESEDARQSTFVF